MNKKLLALLAVFSINKSTFTNNVSDVSNNHLSKTFICDGVIPEDASDCFKSWISSINDGDLIRKLVHDKHVYTGKNEKGIKAFRLRCDDGFDELVGYNFDKHEIVRFTGVNTSADLHDVQLGQVHQVSKVSLDQTENISDLIKNGSISDSLKHKYEEVQKFFKALQFPISYIMLGRDPSLSSYMHSLNGKKFSMETICDEVKSGRSFSDAFQHMHDTIKSEKDKSELQGNISQSEGVLKAHLSSENDELQEFVGEQTDALAGQNRVIKSKVGELQVFVGEKTDALASQNGEIKVKVGELQELVDQRTLALANQNEEIKTKIEDAIKEAEELAQGVEECCVELKDKVDLTNKQFEVIPGESPDTDEKTQRELLLKALANSEEAKNKSRFEHLTNTNELRVGVSNGSMFAYHFVYHFISDKSSVTDAEAMVIIKELFANMKCGFGNPSNDLLEAVRLVAEKVDAESFDSFKESYKNIVTFKTGLYPSSSLEITSTNTAINDYMRWMMPIWIKNTDDTGGALAQNVQDNFDQELKDFIVSQYTETSHDMAYNLVRWYAHVAENTGSAIKWAHNAIKAIKNVHIHYMFPIFSGYVDAMIDEERKINSSYSYSDFYRTKQDSIVLDLYGILNAFDIDLNTVSLADKYKIQDEMVKIAITYASDIPKYLSELYSTNPIYSPIKNTSDGYYVDRGWIDSNGDLYAVLRAFVIAINTDDIEEISNSYEQSILLRNILKHGFNNTMPNVYNLSTTGSGEDYFIKGSGSTDVPNAEKSKLWHLLNRSTGDSHFLKFADDNNAFFKITDFFASIMRNSDVYGDEDHEILSTIDAWIGESVAQYMNSGDEARNANYSAHYMHAMRAFFEELCCYTSKRLKVANGQENKIEHYAAIYALLNKSLNNYKGFTNKMHNFFEEENLPAMKVFAFEHSVGYIMHKCIKKIIDSGNVGDDSLIGAAALKEFFDMSAFYAKTNFNIER
ncbi:hypothetical protein FZC35_00955 [Candidatus Cytomitobacter indipagum]|uniref:Uncharacterized protein n=1 Tax=Candidatus Cytomitobacter indipagum TaxID=2601575 RepID=A0A5C0UE18_9PROT|nr:hypothetical protein [Candidatus Cytomitobacter indipagum]QEK37950.1 hypothetical protein FZC35_00955 [Candidatus Cytomitobacter indipagum]